MFTVYKQYIGSFFIALWAITHMLQLGHEVSHLMLTHHLDRCSHHHHHEVKKLERSSDYIILFEDCVVCDFDWFNLLEHSTQFSISNAILAIVPSKLGQSAHALAENWISKSFPQRGPPIKS